MAARAATSDELTKFRSDGQRLIPYLAIRKPSVIYTALFSATVPAASTDMVLSVTYTGGSGTLSDVKAGMSLYVGSSAGARDLGVARIRKLPVAGTFYVGETSEIDWINVLGYRDAGSPVYLTVVDDVTIWARHIKRVSGINYMDGDIAYSDQHTNFAPIVIMGGDRVLWRTGATVSYTWPSDQADNSYDPSGVATISSYLWTCAGAFSSSGTATATPTFTFDADGQYVVWLKITLSNGKNFTACRTIYVFSSENMPCVDFKITSPARGSQDQGGWSFEVELYAEDDFDAITDRTQVILFARDFYGADEISIGPLAGSENILCEGWIEGQTIEWNKDQHSVRFQVTGAHAWLKRIPAFMLGIETTSKTATDWTNIKNLTPRLMLWHLCHWRSNLDQVCDVHLTTDTRQMRSLDMQQASLWAQMVACAHDQILADPYTDRYGALYVYVEQQLTTPATRSTFPSIMEITDEDWHDTMDVTRFTQATTGRVELSGVHIPNPGSKGTAIFSLAPGHVPKHYGDLFPQDYLLLASQAQSNTLSGALLAWQNHEFEFDFEIPANMRLIDIAPRAFFPLTILSADAPRIAYDGRLVTREVTFKIDENGAMSVGLHTEQETVPDLSVNGDVPDHPTPPPTPPPPEPPPPPDPPPGPAPDMNGYAVVWIAGHGFFYTMNWGDDIPLWADMNTGLEGLSDFKGLGVSSSGQVITLVRGSSPGNKFYMSPMIGEGWVPSAIPNGGAMDLTDPASGHTPLDGAICGWSWDPALEDDLILMTFGTYDIFHTRLSYCGAGGFNSITINKDTGAINGLSGTYPYVDYHLGADGTYLLCAISSAGVIGVINAGASGFPGNFPTLTAIVDAQSTILNQTLYPIDGVITRSLIPYVSADNGASWVHPASGPQPYSTNYDTEACAVNMDATVAMVGTHVSDEITEHGLMVSEDGGLSYAENVQIFGSVSCINYIKREASVDYWAVCRLGQILQTDDNGATFLDKTGNLADLVPDFEVAALRIF